MEKTPLFSAKTFTSISILFALMLVMLFVTPERHILSSSPGLNISDSKIISPDEAAAIAVNKLTAFEDGFRLTNPRHIATFSENGISFTARRGGLNWSWQLIRANGGENSLHSVNLDALKPVNTSPRNIQYNRD